MLSKKLPTVKVLQCYILKLSACVLFKRTTDGEFTD